MAPPSVTPRSGSALYTVYMSTPTLSPPIRHYEGLFVLHAEAEFLTLNLKYVDGEREAFTLKSLLQYVGTWFPWLQGHPLISGAMPLESGAGFA